VLVIRACYNGTQWRGTFDPVIKGIKLLNVVVWNFNVIDEVVLEVLLENFTVALLFQERCH
jgi:hypothetical protein